MSYIQIETGGRMRGLKFNQGAVMYLNDKVDQSNWEATSGYAIFWGGLKANAFVKGEELTKTVDDNEVPATFEDVCDWYDNLTDEQRNSINECFSESQVYKKALAKQQDDEKKSQLPGPSTEQSATVSDAVS